MKLLASGSRDWDDPLPVRRLITRLTLRHPHEELIVVQGRARGLDTMIADVADEVGWLVQNFPAAWKEHHPDWCQCGPVPGDFCRRAGYRRNQQMVDLPAITHGVFFTDKEDGEGAPGGGTGDCFARALHSSIPSLTWFSHRRLWLPIRTGAA